MTSLPASRARPTIGVVDYGAGNLVSIGQALEVSGADVRLVSRPRGAAGIDGLIVPGVGASGPAMATLERTGLAGAIRSAIGNGVPYLGICLGLQLLFERSEEDGAEGFGVLPGEARLIRNAPRLPHIGWNAVVRLREHPLFEGIARDAPFYFVHSYAGEPRDTDVALATTEHGDTFTSACAVDRLAGVQFHPERSAADGLRLLANFVGLVREPERWPMRTGSARAGSGLPVTAGRAED